MAKARRPRYLDPDPTKAMQSRRHLGQYFTPSAVVDLAYDLLEWLAPSLTQGYLVDPSCGDGAFLQGALRAGFAPRRLYGCDMDPALATVWNTLGLRSAGGPHLAVCDGLIGGAEGAFDVVVGNPPFAGSQALPADVAERGRFRWGQLVRQRQWPPRLPRELWFLERSVHLLRDGGLLAMVLPSGIFANRRWEPLRAALFAEVQVEAIVGLPRETFRASGAVVRTCLFVARKTPLAPGHRVRLAELEAEELSQASATLRKAWERQETIAAAEPWSRQR
ncbi:MAG: N-6 DNA methylase [Armatimonadetes bacterium]|nr:N-6 DNA methylase [Armatimonadota bacterium]